MAGLVRPSTSLFLLGFFEDIDARDKRGLDEENEAV
jgi:hypothetical protein